MDTPLAALADGLAARIRNPLNAARLGIAVAERRLDRTTPDVAGAREAIASADVEIAILARLVRELLEFACPEPLHLVRADLRASVESVVRLERPDAEGAGVQVTLEAAGPVQLVYDDERMKQVLMRLIRNAIEATGPGGHVWIRITTDGGVRIVVQDDGAGLPAAPDRVFAPFFTTRPGRIGLSLAIVEREVVAHGGTITVDSEPGRTTFAISLPPDDVGRP